MTVYVISTRHDEFADRKFEPGDTVIDPWRYIRDQPGVNVRRLGENRPELISLLVPSRGRPKEFSRMWLSAINMATYPNRLECVVYLDENDPKLSAHYPDDEAFTYYNATFTPLNNSRLWPKPIYGEQIVLSEMWNQCYAKARGNILMHCGDDIVFRTPGWDTIVRDTFDRTPDKIALVHGDDLFQPSEGLATHGFLHRRWVDTVGYFVPPLFSSDWNDVWLTDVADRIGRRIMIPIVTEHLHYAAGKSEYDQTYREREERGARDGVVELYNNTGHQRAEDAAKLRAVMA